MLALFGIKKAPSAKQLREMLPSLHSFVDVAVKDGPKGSVCIENVTLKSFVTTALDGMRSGQSANFLYANAHGKYRFKATITAVSGKQATFAIPARIETVQSFGGARRSTVRVDTTVPTQWRYAPAGRIETEWQRGIVSDISRTGCSLSGEKVVRTGDTLEVKLPVLADGGTISVRAQVKRVDGPDVKKRVNLGLAFVHLTEEAERAVSDYINRRQTDLRKRGLG